MKTKMFYFFALLISAMPWNACQNTASKPSIAGDGKNSTPTVSPPVEAVPDAWVVINGNGNNTLFGKKVDIKQLVAALEDTIYKMKTLPNIIPVKFNEEILMGTRADIKEQLKGVLDKAKLHIVLMSDKPEDMVKNFYGWYLEKLNSDEGYQLLDNKNDAESTLTPGFYARLLKQKKEGLDSDPLLLSQDFGKDWGTVTILDKLAGAPANKMSYKIQLGNVSNDKTAIAPRKLQVSLSDTKQGWRIDKVTE